MHVWATAIGAGGAHALQAGAAATATWTGAHGAQAGATYCAPVTHGVVARCLLRKSPNKQASARQGASTITAHVTPARVMRCHERIIRSTFLRVRFEHPSRLRPPMNPQSIS